jgi:uncharacterized protein
MTMPIRQSSFQAPRWLAGPNRQTIWNTVIGRKPPVDLRRERFELSDGDFVDLDWLVGGQGPIVVVLHGLGGSSDSPYVRGLLKQVQAMGWRGLILNFRGCSGEPNRLMRAYHSGDTGDVAEVVAAIRAREPDTPLVGVGYSLGGNVLLKWLGETGDQNPLAGVVAVSVPFDLDTCADCLNKGFSQVYEWRFVRGLKEHYALKAPLSELPVIRSIREWDEEVTAPLHGFDGATDYYSRSSSGQFLAGIQVPTLVLHATDDPFMDETVIPKEEALSEQVTLELSATGGHVGFVMGSPLRPVYWLEERIPAFLRTLPLG